MSAAIRQAPGWWPSLVQAVCDRCGWLGPVRSLSEPCGAVLARLDARDHDCGGAR